ncbi:uncharacterized protein LOC129565649 [Sitodiplosis mosellana]|uniref:uncharacterized protein LOC129565649 n=1 Tax=Sitodiplosis mosellana TaxID=263140 RepID=UPI0024443515|nr:uncharacterized protein LOC129565649 [Sitodiplosis mosellana]
MQFVPVLPLKKRVYVEPVNNSNRKLLISPIPSWMKLSSVVQYYENFGKIIYGQLFPGQTFGHGVVQFESEDNARKALKNRYHSIGKYIVNVKPADDQPIGNNTTKEATHMLDLDDDCLLKIFDDFDLIEWCDVANTCKRFQKIAENTFISEFDSETHVIEGEIKDDTEKLYKTFGALMTNVRIGFNENKSQADVFKFIVKYCGDKLLYLRPVNLKWTSSLRLDNDTKTKLKSLVIGDY